MQSSITVEIPEKNKSYPIYIDSDDIFELNDKIFEKIGENSYLIIMSQKVYKLYKHDLCFPKDRIFVLKDGEKEKNFINYCKIMEKAQKLKLNRKSYIIAVGGGVVGDISGFVAATYMRGINFIQVPTTLLACVDASVGGKVAIDTKLGKNFIGCFYQPKAVFININFLKTLDKKQYKSGLAEIIKYAFIEKSCETMYEYGLFDFLLVHHQKVLDKDFRFLEKIIKVCIQLKVSVISKDEKEAGLRKILNFGHTYGHAIEKYTDYKITHGEAVFLGMYMIFNYACNLNIIDANYKEKAFNLLDQFNPKKKKIKTNPKKIIKLMKTDKKAEDDIIKIIVPTTKGYVKEVDFDEELALEYKLL